MPPAVCHFPFGRLIAPGMCPARKSLGRRTSTTLIGSPRFSMPSSSNGPVVKASLPAKYSAASRAVGMRVSRVATAMRVSSWVTFAPSRRGTYGTGWPRPDNPGWRHESHALRNEWRAVEHLADIAMFVKVAELGSFTAAAEALESSQPVVSKAVTRLEQRLGVRLLNRTTRRLSLTEAGAELYAQGSRALAALDNVQLEIARFQTEPRGTLRINAPMAFTLLHLQRKLPAFLERYPSVTLDLTTEDRVVDLIEEGYDAAIRIGVLESSQLIARKIAPCRQVICAAPAYLAKHGTPLEAADLMSHNCIVYTLGRDARAWRLLDEQG